MLRRRVSQRGGRAIAAGLVISSVVAAITLGAAPAASQGGGWASLFPGAEDLGPPDWVKPGSRITFYEASASVKQTSGEDARSASGEGFFEVDIVAFDGNDVLGSVTAYQWDRDSDVKTYAPYTGARSPGAAVDTVWLHPDLLTRMLEGAGPAGFDAVRTPYPLNGTTYDAIRVSTDTAATTFDSATGLVLVSTIGTATPGNGAPNSEGSYQEFRASRVRTVPGIGAAVPAWLKAPTTLRYEGTWYSDAFRVESPAQMELRFDRVGRDWASVAVHEVRWTTGVPFPEDFSATSGGAGPYWYDPAALGAMRAGDELDADPVTGARTSVVALEQGPRGPQVRIETAMTGSRLELTFDQATGMLLVYDLTQQALRERMRVELQEAP